jgi:hypothetical protein
VSIGKIFSFVGTVSLLAICVPSGGAIVFRAEFILFLFCCASSAPLYSPPRSAMHPARLAQQKKPNHPDK